MGYSAIVLYCTHNSQAQDWSDSWTFFIFLFHSLLLTLAAAIAFIPPFHPASEPRARQTRSLISILQESLFANLEWREGGRVLYFIYILFSFFFPKKLSIKIPVSHLSCPALPCPPYLPPLQALVGINSPIIPIHRLSHSAI